MVRRPGDKTPEPPDGRAAERLPLLPANQTGAYILNRPDLVD